MTEIEILKKEATTKMIDLILLSLRITKPELTKHQVENIIINVGNQLQLERLQNIK